GPDPRNFNQRVSLGRNDLLIRTFPKPKPQIVRVTASAARAPFHSEGGDNRNNIIVKLSEAALDNLDRVGYELVRKYRLAGYTQEHIRMIALSHLLEAA
ncbi:hypothetical protein ACJEQI_21920, partial [Klebsiella variicola]